jgi:hypothetical protein
VNSTSQLNKSLSVLRLATIDAENFPNISNQQEIREFFEEFANSWTLCSENRSIALEQVGTVVRVSTLVLFRCMKRDTATLTKMKSRYEIFQQSSGLASFNTVDRLLLQLIAAKYAHHETHMLQNRLMVHDVDSAHPVLKEITSRFL